MALLRQGSRGQDVANIQDALNTAGRTKLAPLGVDGIFGPKARARVVEFQAQNSLGADGIVGPKTMGKLQHHTNPGGVPIAPGGGGGGGGGGGAQGKPGDVVSQVTSAASSALASWRTSARFRGVTINALAAMASPGCVTGPDVSGLILGSVAMDTLTPDDRKIAKAAAGGIGTSMTLFQASIQVPGVPWYPSFASWPGPVAPPTPNVPTPLASMANAGALSVGAIQANIMANGGNVAGAGNKVAAISAAVGSKYSAFAATASVKLVMGQGPVPSYAPPMVNEGPVIGGSVISGGGHF